MAKFISPDEVQRKLLKKQTANVQILEMMDIGRILHISSGMYSRLYAMQYC